VDQAGEVSSHMAGFDPASFEGLLTERIDEARQSK
jgi:hypothetical protein